MAEKRKRSQNFTSEEKQKLVKLLMEHKSTILSKKTDKNTNEAKILAWNQLTASFNATGTVHRTQKSLLKAWEKIKYERKQQSNKNVKNVKLTLLKEELEAKRKLYQSQIQAAEKDLVIKDLEIEIKKALLEQVRGGGLTLQYLIESQNKDNKNNLLNTNYF